MNLAQDCWLTRMRLTAPRILLVRRKEEAKLLCTDRQSAKRKEADRWRSYNHNSTEGYPRAVEVSFKKRERDAGGSHSRFDTANLVPRTLCNHSTTV